MLRINRLRIEINTANGMYGVDEIFGSGLNFVASLDNTCGKSSILAGIYYCLGFEQILGGVGGIGSKVLTSVFKSTIDDDDKSWGVTESGAFLEIGNGSETITVYRNIRSESKDNHLITVYHGGYEEIANPKTLSEDFYVNYPHSATGKKGFHAFLEEFLHLELPLVRAADGNERKLYIQIVFAAMLIEQKHGWSDILSGMPIFGIRESKKRVVEYILGLDNLKNEKERERLSALKVQIEHEWKQLVTEMHLIAHSGLTEIINLPQTPHVLSEKDFNRIALTVDGGQIVEEVLVKLQGEYDGLRQLKPRVIDNFESLNAELSATESSILEMEASLVFITEQLAGGNIAIAHLESDVEIINSDIRNNEDAARLQKFGSEETDGELSAQICPTCRQHIQDSLLPVVTEVSFMSIDDNIKHLKEQKKVLEFSLNGRRKSRDEMQLQKQQLEAKLQTLRRLAQSLRSDLNSSLDTEASEAIILKKIEITRRIEQLNLQEDKMSASLEMLTGLSKQWNTYLDQKRNLPNKFLTDSDGEKSQLLKTRFIENLRLYNYSSLSSFDGIDISAESLLPTVDGFDMKFDSSASDGIRVIWAFTMALLQVSVEKGGNHPGVVIFDEPAQQSIVSENLSSFVESAIKLSEKSQIIMAITLNSKELVDIIEGLDKDSYHKIDIVGKAFKKIIEI